MFHFTGYRVLFPTFPTSNQLVARGFGKRRWPIKTIRLPHSEISGSKRTCRSPKLIAAYHVLHRLLAPRHPLCALKSLIPCLKSATRTSWIRDRGSWIVDLIFKSFHALSVFRPTYNRFPLLESPAIFAVKIIVFGNQNIFKDRKNSSQGVAPARGLLHFAISCSQSNHISLHMDVKERTCFFRVRNQPCVTGKWWA